MLFVKEFEQQIIPNCIDKFFRPLPSESVWSKPSAVLMLCVTDGSSSIYEIGSQEFPGGRISNLLTLGSTPVSTVGPVGCPTSAPSPGRVPEGLWLTSNR